MSYNKIKTLIFIIITPKTSQRRVNLKLELHQQLIQVNFLCGSKKPESTVTFSINLQYLKKFPTGKTA